MDKKLFKIFFWNKSFSCILWLAVIKMTAAILDCNTAVSVLLIFEG